MVNGCVDNALFRALPNI